MNILGEAYTVRKEVSSIMVSTLIVNNVKCLPVIALAVMVILIFLITVMGIQFNNQFFCLGFIMFVECILFVNAVYTSR